jgi:hypothetical protein
MPPRHRRPDGDAVVFRDRLDVLEPEVCERSSKPGTRGKKGINAFRIPILLVGIVFRFPIDEIRSDDLIRQNRIAGFNQTKRGDRNVLVLLEAHFALRALVCSAVGSGRAALSRLIRPPPTFSRTGSRAPEATRSASEHRAIRRSAVIASEAKRSRGRRRRPTIHWIATSLRS